MNSSLQRILSALFALIAIYFLVWPFINSEMSSEYYIYAITEGSPNDTYAVHFGGNNTLSVTVDHLNNVATEKQGADATLYETEISDDTLKNLETVAKYYRGGHLIVRQHAGYVFYYDGMATTTSFFFRDNTRQEILEFAQIATLISRGTEKYPDRDHGLYKTYQEYGEQKLTDFMDKLGLM